MRLFRYFKNQTSYLSNRQFFCPEARRSWEIFKIDDFLFWIFEVVGAAVPLLQKSTIIPQQSSIFFFLRSWTWKI